MFQFHEMYTPPPKKAGTSRREAEFGLAFTGSKTCGEAVEQGAGVWSQLQVLDSDLQPGQPSFLSIRGRWIGARIAREG